MNNKKEMLELRAKCVAEYFLMNKTTMSKTAKAFGVSADTIGKDLNVRLKMIDEDLYKKVKEQIENNKRVSAKINCEVESKMKQLQNCFQDSKVKNHSYVAVRVLNEDKEEVRIHHFSSFKDELTNYEKTFNAGLVDKKNKSVKILEFKSLKDLDGIF